MGIFSNLFSSNKEETVEESTQEGSFIVCSYLTGIKNAPEIYKNPAVLTIKNDTNSLFINIKAQNDIQITIDDTNIKSIIVSKSMIVNHDDGKIVDYTGETQYLAALLMGPFGPIVGEKLAKSGRVNVKADVNAIYKIEIFYTDTEDKRLVFQTRENPNDFFQKYSSILTIK